MHARIRTLAVLPSLTILLAAGAGSFAAFADDVLAQFKQTPAKAQEAVMSAVWAGGQPYIDGSWVIFRALSPEARASAVRAAADFARAYASSDAFKKQYAANRTSQAPKPPTPPKSWAEQHAEQNAQFAKSMADMKANLPKMPANMQKSMQDTIDQMQAQHEAQEKDAEFQAMMEKSVTMGYESREAAVRESAEAIPVGAPRGSERARRDAAEGVPRDVGDGSGRGPARARQRQDEVRGQVARGEAVLLEAVLSRREALGGRRA